VSKEIDVGIAKVPGIVTIAPPGRGDVDVPKTRLRVPAILSIKVQPVGDGAEYTPVPLELVVGLVDRESGQTAFTGMWEHVSPEVVRIGDWRYEVAKMAVEGPVTPAVLAAIRLPGLLRRALQHLVLVVTDEGWTIDPHDRDEVALVAYVSAQLIGEDPVQAVATQLDVKPNAAAQRIYRLRRAGRLPAVKKGAR
jgi:hypothetical protein